MLQLLNILMWQSAVYHITFATIKAFSKSTIICVVKFFVIPEDKVSNFSKRKCILKQTSDPALEWEPCPQHYWPLTPGQGL